MVELEWKPHTGSNSCASYVVEPPRSCTRTSKKVWPAPRTMEKKTLFGSQARWHFLFPFPYCDLWLERPHQHNCGYWNSSVKEHVPAQKESATTLKLRLEGHIGAPANTIERSTCSACSSGHQAFENNSFLFWKKKNMPIPTQSPFLL